MVIDKVLNNAGTVAALAFSGVGLLLLVVVVVAGLFGVKLDAQTFDLVKTVTQNAMMFGLGSGVTVAAQRAAQVRAARQAPNDPRTTGAGTNLPRAAGK